MGLQTQERLRGSIRGHRTLVVLCALAMFQASWASAAVSCDASSSPPIVRAEGITELAGDIVLSCTSDGSSGGVKYEKATVSVALNVNATNNRGFGFGLFATDAVLVVNENHTLNPRAASIFGGPDPRFPVPQFGRLSDDNRLVWDQVNFPIPGAADLPAVITIRIANVRVNASQLGVKYPDQFPPPPVAATVSVAGSSLLNVSDATVNVALPVPGLSASLGDGPDPGAFVVRLREGFFRSFKLLGTPAFTPSPSGEAGYPTPNSGVNGGGATQRTRVRIGFDNVPAGLAIRLPDQLPNESSGDPVFFDRVMNADANCRGGFLISGPGLGLVPISDGSGVACYEVTRTADPDVLEKTEVAMETSGGSFTEVKVSVSLAPTSDVLASEGGEPVPRFVAADPLSRAAFRIVSGNEQSGPVNSVLPIPLTVQLTDHRGFGVPDVPIIFQLREGNEFFTFREVPTDGVGWASASVVLPSLARLVEIVVSAPGFDPLTFFVTSEPIGAPGITAPRIDGIVGSGMSIPSVEQVSPLAIVSIFGQDFVDEGIEASVAEADLVDGRLPSVLAGACVQIGPEHAPLFHVSPTQMVAQVPRQPLRRDTAVVQVRKNCGQPAGIGSNIRDVALRATSPEFFFFTRSMDGVNPIAALNNTTGKLVGTPGLLPAGEFAQARPGDIVTVFMTGLGLTAPPLESGELALGPADAAAEMRAFVNDQEVAVIYAGATPGTAGLYQVSFALPNASASGRATVRMEAGGIATPAGGFLAIE